MRGYKGGRYWGAGSRNWKEQSMVCHAGGGKEYVGLCSRREEVWWVIKVAALEEDAGKVN